LSALAGEGLENGAQGEAGNGDCSGLRHRYATTADGDTNAVEDQMDDLLKVMTAAALMHAAVSTPSTMVYITDERSCFVHTFHVAKAAAAHVLTFLVLW